MLGSWGVRVLVGERVSGIAALYANLLVHVAMKVTLQHPNRSALQHPRAVNQLTSSKTRGTYSVL